jgi:hypothetical protein
MRELMFSRAAAVTVFHYSFALQFKTCAPFSPRFHPALAFLRTEKMCAAMSKHPQTPRQHASPQIQLPENMPRLEYWPSIFFRLAVSNRSTLQSWRSPVLWTSAAVRAPPSPASAAAAASVRWRVSGDCLSFFNPFICLKLAGCAV